MSSPRRWKAIGGLGGTLRSSGSSDGTPEALPVPAPEPEQPTVTTDLLGEGGGVQLSFSQPVHAARTPHSLTPGYEQHLRCLMRQLSLEKSADMLMGKLQQLSGDGPTDLCAQLCGHSLLVSRSWYSCPRHDVVEMRALCIVIGNSLHMTNCAGCAFFPGFRAGTLSTRGQRVVWYR